MFNPIQNLVNCVCIWIIKDITNPGIDSFNINMDYRRCKKTFSALLLGSCCTWILSMSQPEWRRSWGLCCNPWIFTVMELQVVYNHFYSRLIEASHPIRCMGFALDTIFRLDVLQRTTLQHHLLVWWFQTLFIFHNIWDNPSHWLSFSRWLKPPTSLYPYLSYIFSCQAINKLPFGILQGPNGWWLSICWGYFRSSKWHHWDHHGGSGGPW